MQQRYEVSRIEAPGARQKCRGLDVLLVGRLLRL
jgi:hypothetical protein